MLSGNPLREALKGSANCTWKRAKGKARGGWDDVVLGHVQTHWQTLFGRVCSRVVVFLLQMQVIAFQPPSLPRSSHHTIASLQIHELTTRQTAVLAARNAAYHAASSRDSSLISKSVIS